MSALRLPARLAALALAVAGTAVAVPVGPVVADPAPATISAMVTLQGVPAQRGQIEAYLYTKKPTGGFEGQGYYYTDESGRFTIPVPDGTYYVYVDGFDEGYAGEWYDDTYFSAEAVPIVVAGASVALRPVDLAPTVSLKGTITGDGEPLGCPGITVYRRDASGTYRFYLDEAAIGNDETHYYLAGLKPGTFKLQGYDTCDGFRPRWYVNSLTLADATPVTVTTGVATVGNLDLHDAPMLEGTLLGRDGVPVRHQLVRAYDPAQGYEVSDRTNSRGEFFVNVGAGHWQLQLSDGGEDHGPTQWYQSWDRAGTPTFALGPDDDDLDLGAVTFQPGGTVEGRVLDPSGGPRHRIQVEVYDSGGHFIDSDVTALDGGYRFSELPGDAYRLGFHAIGGGVVPTYYPAAPTLADATPVQVDNDETIELDDVVLTDTGAGLPAGTNVWGYVTGPGGRPEPGVEVCAKGAPPDSVHPFCNAFVFTDANGRYALTGLDPATSGLPLTTFRIQYTDPHFSDLEETYLAERWSGGAATYDAADTIEVGPTAVRADMALPSYAGVEGTITTDLGFPPSAVRVHVYTPDGAPVRTVRTDPDGHYRIPDLPAGSYRLHVEASDGEPLVRFVPLWWADADDLASSDAVVAAAGSFATADLTLQHHLTARTAPTIDGTPAVGSTLHADPGTWTGEAPVFTYVWLRDAEAVGYGPDHVVQPADAGHGIKVRVIASEFDGTDETFTGTAESAPMQVPGPPATAPPVDAGPGAGHPSRAPSAITARGTYHPGGRRASFVVLRLLVESGGTPVSDGTVTVTEHGRLRAADVRLSDGHAVVRLRHPGHRRHVYLVGYSGSATIAVSATTVRVDTR